MGVRYVYDTTVPNGRYSMPGDLVVVRDNPHRLRRWVDRQQPGRARPQDQVLIPWLHEHGPLAPQQETVAYRCAARAAEFDVPAEEELSSTPT
jgi:hypothetical protein